MVSGCLSLLIVLLGPAAVGALLFLGISSSVGVPPPPVIDSVPIMATPTFTPEAAANFTPLTRTIWNAEPGKDRREGTCGEAMVNYCAYMAALTPQSEELLFKGMELEPYVLKKVSGDVYAYSGRSMVGDGDIDLQLTFTSATEFRLDQVLVLDADPQCRHITTFAGTFMR